MAVAIHMCRIALNRLQPEISCFPPFTLILQPLRLRAHRARLGGRRSLTFRQISCYASRESLLSRAIRGLIIAENAECELAPRPTIVPVTPKPIQQQPVDLCVWRIATIQSVETRSEEHTSELQSPVHL